MKKKTKVFLSILLIVCFVFVGGVVCFADALVEGDGASNASVQEFFPIFDLRLRANWYNSVVGQMTRFDHSMIFDNINSCQFLNASAYQQKYLVYSDSTPNYSPSASKDYTVTSLSAPVSSSSFNYSSVCSLDFYRYANQTLQVVDITSDLTFVRLHDWDDLIPKVIFYPESGDTGISWPCVVHVEVGELSVEGHTSTYNWYDLSFDRTFYAATSQMLLPNSQWLADHNGLWTELTSRNKGGVVPIRIRITLPTQTPSLYIGSIHFFQYGSSSVVWSDYWARWYFANCVEFHEVTINGDTWLDWIVNGVGGFLDTPLFGEFTLGSLFLVIMGIAVFNLFVHMFRG